MIDMMGGPACDHFFPTPSHSCTDRGAVLHGMQVSGMHVSGMSNAADSLPIDIKVVTQGLSMQAQ